MISLCWVTEHGQGDTELLQRPVFMGSACCPPKGYLWQCPPVRYGTKVRKFLYFKGHKSSAVAEEEETQHLISSKELPQSKHQQKQGFLPYLSPASSSSWIEQLYERNSSSWFSSARPQHHWRALSIEFSLLKSFIKCNHQFNLGILSVGLSVLWG